MGKARKLEVAQEVGEGHRTCDMKVEARGGGGGTWLGREMDVKGRTNQT